MSIDNLLFASLRFDILVHRVDKPIACPYANIARCDDITSHEDVKVKEEAYIRCPIIEPKH